MSRIQLVDPSQSTGETKILLDAVQDQFGLVPNFIRALANSPSALSAFLGLAGPLNAARLDLRTREQIALALAEGNACQYCLSAHEELGRQAGLAEPDLTAARRGGSLEGRADAAVRFAVALNGNSGEVSTAEFEAVRTAGLSDAEIVEIIAVTALNIFTNVLGKAGRIDIDFPHAQPLAAAA